MQVVLLHDWLLGNREEERVLEDLCEMYPEAPIYTLFHKKGSCSPVIENRKIICSFLNRIPGIYKNFSSYLPLFAIATESLKITERPKVVISSAQCVIKGVKLPDGARHISYLHGPMKYIYQDSNNMSLLSKFGAWAVRPYLRTWDRIANEKIDRFCTQSKEAKESIRKIYNLDSTVIHPSSHINRDRVDKPKENFFLLVTDFRNEHSIGLIIETFNKQGLPLKIVGNGPKVGAYRFMAKPNIRFLGELPVGKILDLMAKARGYINPSEQFDLFPLEAISMGTPILTYKNPMNLEYFSWDTSVFFEAFSLPELENALRTFCQRDFKREDFARYSEVYSPARFKEEMESVVQNVLN